MLAAGYGIWLATPARAEPAAQSDAVALLPLDADRSLEIYGQPVASELARALVAGSVQVVVVGPKMAVPERARLIIDGTIALGKASTVTISLRIRNTLDGTVLDSLSATAPGLAQLDSAAGELSARILPIVRDKLAALGARQVPRDDHGHGRIIRAQAPAIPIADRVVLIGLADATPGTRGGPLLGALDTAVSEWVRAHHRKSRKLEVAKLDPKIASSAVEAGSAELAIGLWILAYAPEPGALPMARARVQVRIADGNAILFDRVIATDTVLGDTGLGQPELAARVAREVLAIVRPHMRRRVASWE